MAQKGIRREKGSGTVFQGANGKYVAKYPMGSGVDGAIQYKKKPLLPRKK